jgi:hypothetical protein
MLHTVSRLQALFGVSILEDKGHARNELWDVVYHHRIDTGPEVSLRRYFVRNFTSADVKIRHHMTPSWSAHGSFS